MWFGKKFGKVFGEKVSKVFTCRNEKYFIKVNNATKQ